METFDALPIAAIVNGLYLAMHGGISHRLTSIEAINAVNRQMEPLFSLQGLIVLDKILNIPADDA